MTQPLAYPIIIRIFVLNSIFHKLFMNHYETVFILTPVLSDAQMKEAVDKFTSHLTSAGATIVNDEHWGLK